jgi:hypothetical protein
VARHIVLAEDGDEAKRSAQRAFVCDIAFGDLTRAEAMRTTQLLARKVIPAFPEKAAAAVLD